MRHPVIADRLAGRIYPNGQVKQDAAYPHLTQEVLTVNRPGTLAGRCPSENPVVQLTVWASTKAEVDTLMAAIDDQLERYKRRPILGCTHSDYQSEPLPDSPNVYADSSNWSVWYTRG